MEEAVSEKKKPGKYGKYEDYDIESAARTLTEADEIRSDKEKMKYVAQCLRAKVDAMTDTISSLDDLKKLANKKSMEEKEEAYT